MPSTFIRKRLWGGKKAQLIKWLPYKRKDWFLIPSSHIKAVYTAASICNLSAGVKRVKTGRNLEFIGH